MKMKSSNKKSDKVNTAKRDGFCARLAGSNLFKRLLLWLGGIIATALITAIFVSFFVGDPNVATQVSLSNQNNQQLLIADLVNRNILSALPWLFKIADPKISINFFTLIQKKGGDGSINTCWINGTHSNAAISLGYGESVPATFDFSQEKSALLNTKLRDQYNAVSYARINYSYAYQNRISLSEKNYSGIKIYMLFPVSTSSLSLVDMFADGDSPVYPTNLVDYPNNLIVTAMPSFSPLRNAQELECQNYHVKNNLGTQYQMTN